MKTLLGFFLLTAATVLAEPEHIALPPPPTAAEPAAPAATPATPGTTSAPAAQPSSFPGVKVIMTPEEYSRAGLDALSPDQIGVIDAAIIRHYLRTVNVAASQEAEQISQQAVEEDRKRTWLSRVGLPDLSLSQDWKTAESVKARCTGWVTGNSFKLDNDQVWQGVDPIRMELSGREIEIQARPNGGFALVVDGKNTTMRVIRVK
jgi:hypothetical protein